MPAPSEGCVKLTRWSRIFENLIFAHVIKIFLNNFETRIFISVFIAICPHSYLCEIYFNIILIFMLNAWVSQVVCFSHRNFVCISYFSRGCYIKHAHRVEGRNWAIAIRSVLSTSKRNIHHLHDELFGSEFWGLRAVNLW